MELKAYDICKKIHLCLSLSYLIDIIMNHLILIYYVKNI